MVCRKTQAVIVRCGQPQVGPAQRLRCKEDEQLLNGCLPSLSKGKVLDTRTPETVAAHTSKGAAMLCYHDNRIPGVAGGGVELPAHYPRWRLEYGKMESKAAIAASLARLREACADCSPSWWGRVEASGWLAHVTRLLGCAKFLALCVHRDGECLPHTSLPSSLSLSHSAASVVVHGASGTDAALQVTSLAQLLLDPQTRTMAGYMPTFHLSLFHTHTHTDTHTHTHSLSLSFPLCKVCRAGSERVAGGWASLQPQTWPCLPCP